MEYETTIFSSTIDETYEIFKQYEFYKHVCDNHKTKVFTWKGCMNVYLERELQIVRMILLWYANVISCMLAYSITLFTEYTIGKNNNLTLSMYHFVIRL